MLSLRSLAFILASVKRRARALSWAALHRSPDSMSGRQTAENMATKTLTKMAASLAFSMSVSSEQDTRFRLRRLWLRGGEEPAGKTCGLPRFHIMVKTTQRAAARR
jgi:hypothetical protein